MIHFHTAETDTITFTINCMLFYVLFFIIVFDVILFLLIDMYCYQCYAVRCMNVFYVDYSSIWLMFLLCDIDYKYTVLYYLNILILSLHF